MGRLIKEMIDIVVGMTHLSSAVTLVHGSWDLYIGFRA